MYPNPKTKRGQALCQTLFAFCIFVPIVYCLAMLMIPFAPGNSEVGFFEIGPLLTSFIFLMMTFSGFLFAIAVLLNVRRYVALSTNEENSDKLSVALNILYIVLLFVTMLGTLAMMLAGNENVSGKLKTVFMSFSWIWCPLISCALLIVLGILSKKEKKGREKPVFEVNIYRHPIFYIAVIAAVLALLCIPVKNDRRSYEADENDYIYDRTDAYAYSYIKIEDKDSHEMVGYKFVPFPMNYLDTDDIFGIE